MTGFLNGNQLDYVFFHLKNHVLVTDEMKDRFYYVHSLEDTRNIHDGIIFLLSDRPLDITKVIRMENIPILYPLLARPDAFYEDANNNVIFCHDLLKSAFYLLSGYQEYENSGSKDNLQRFSFKDSIQNKLSFTEKPIVNYYFDFIIRGMEQYAARRSKTIVRRRLFKNFGFLLTHDIDKVDAYDLYYIGYKLKEVLGLRNSRLSRTTNVGIFIKLILQWIGVSKKENPYWNFDFLRQVERERKLRSVFFFLDQGVKHSDAYYSFDEVRMRGLFESLVRENCEIGLHGTVKSRDDSTVMQASLNKLEEASHATIKGARQHRLLWNHPQTGRIQLSCRLEYDCTLGFAAHEGFRNSYCMPFKLYDFDKNSTMDLWEFPLNVMDGTLFAYQNYSTSVAMQKCMDLVNEIAKFGGVFDLLWHNSFFDDQTYPGVTKFYVDLLENVFHLNPDNVLGSELLFKVKQHVTVQNVPAE